MDFGWVSERVVPKITESIWNKSLVKLTQFHHHKNKKEKRKKWRWHIKRETLNHLTCMGMTIYEITKVSKSSNHIDRPVELTNTIDLLVTTPAERTME